MVNYYGRSSHTHVRERLRRSASDNVGRHRGSRNPRAMRRLFAFRAAIVSRASI
jgi:hypothetical protein